MKLHPANFDFVDPNWKPLTAELSETKDADPKQLGYGGRDYQVECYKKFKGKRRTIFIAPTGSGKSLVQIFNAAREIIESDSSRKAIGKRTVKLFKQQLEVGMREGTGV